MQNKFPSKAYLKKEKLFLIFLPGKKKYINGKKSNLHPRCDNTTAKNCPFNQDGLFLHILEQFS